MRLAKARLHTQRRHLERKLADLEPMKSVPRPPSGWVKAIRESLGMTARQLGQALNMSSPAITKLEARERDRSITIRDLDRAAAEMGCRVVYALVPDTTLEATLQRQALKTAERLAAKAHHHMTLEAQGVERRETGAQVRELARSLQESLDPRLWEREGSARSKGR
jgi:predicted DNA-binding mobile mystery protein A